MTQHGYHAVSFGYAVNKMQSGMAGDARGFPLIRALYDSR